MTENRTLQFYLDPQAKAKGAKFQAPRLGDAGFDLLASEDLAMAPGAQVLVSTGLKLAIPVGWVGIIKDRSSVSLKRIYTHAGVIDASYRGEVKVVLSNHSTESYHISAGQKFAQMIVVPYLAEAIEVSKAEMLGDTNRGQGGFGSTGK